jgi:hypothetical protein
MQVSNNNHSLVVFHKLLQSVVRVKVKLPADSGATCCHGIGFRSMVSLFKFGQPTLAATLKKVHHK